jgi:hypothetical protein
VWVKGRTQKDGQEKGRKHFKIQRIMEMVEQERNLKYLQIMLEMMMIFFRDRYFSFKSYLPM